MATRPVITGAPTCAPSNIVQFPDTTLARFRRELNHCRSERMLDRWADRIKKVVGDLTYDERVYLGRRAVALHAAFTAEGC